jgi:hypothetical protein
MANWKAKISAEPMNGLKRVIPMAISKLNLPDAVWSCVFCSARNEVFGGSDQEFPLSSCFTSSSAELIKIW